MAAADTASAYVYGLADPSVVREQQEAIERVIFRTLGVSDASRHRVSVSESTGAIEYVDTRAMWGDEPPVRLPEAAEARRTAEDLIAKLARAFTPQGTRDLPEPLRQMSLLPPMARPAHIGLLPRMDKSAWDHWLYRAQPQLVLGPDDRRKLDVFGATLDVRLGENGTVIAFQSQWRPIVNERISVPLTPFAQSGIEYFAHTHGETGGVEHEHAAEPGGEQPEPQLVFLWEGDGVPQLYLAPFWLTAAGHVFTLSSASRYSLAMRLGIKVDDDDGTADVSALVIGGSGDYDFDWGFYPLGDPFAEMEIVGPGSPGRIPVEDGRPLAISRIRLEPGAYMVLVNVRDRRTGAFKHHRQMVFTGMSPATRRPPRDDSPLIA